MAKSAKQTTSRVRKSKLSVLSRFRGLRWQARLLVFASIFAAFSGGYLLYQSYASDLIPKGSNELILSYEIGMLHEQAIDDFAKPMNPTLLLYGNGLLLCSDQSSHGDGHAHVTSETGWRYRQLNRGEVQKLVVAVRNAGFEQAAAYENGKDGILPAASQGRFIRLNTSEGYKKATAYPEDADKAFTKVEEVLNNECLHTTNPYTPDTVLVETLVVPANTPSAANITEELPSDLEIETDPEPKITKQKEFRGNEAKEYRQKIGKDGKIYKKDGKAVKARALTLIPDYQEPRPITKTSGSKVSAATAQKTRWLIVLGEHQERPGWASDVALQDTARSIRSWYKGEVGETFTIDGTLYQVVRGSKTRDEYRRCPAYAGPRCTNDAYAIYYNLMREFQKPGYSTNILTAFVPLDTNILGLGTQPSDFSNDQYTNYYGTIAVTFVGPTNDTPRKNRQVAAHELGHNFALSHRECGNSTLMAACLRSNWPDVRLDSGQSANLRRYSTFFE